MLSTYSIGLVASKSYNSPVLKNRIIGEWDGSEILRCRCRSLIFEKDLLRNSNISKRPDHSVR